jgi:hypothetical protein
MTDVEKAVLERFLSRATHGLAPDQATRMRSVEFCKLSNCSRSGLTASQRDTMSFLSEMSKDPKFEGDVSRMAKLGAQATVAAFLLDFKE